MAIGYTASPGLLALRLPLGRIASLGIITLFTIGVRIALVYSGDFFNVYQTFLYYMVYWTGPWAAIVIVDYFMCKGRYDSADMMTWRGGCYWYRACLLWPSVIAFIASILILPLFFNSETYANPLMTNMLGWEDSSFKTDLISAGVIYWLLARSKMRGWHMFDLIFKGANLPDGRTGFDIAIRDGKIAALERNVTVEAWEVIDVTGRLVTPPFVDAHRLF